MLIPQFSYSQSTTDSHCGALVIDLPEGENTVLDRFGNHIPIKTVESNNLTGFPNCSCSDLGINTGYFELWFEDCSLNTGIGFNDPSEGENNRRAACEVFSQIAATIHMNSGICSGENAVVDVLVLPSGFYNDYFCSSSSPQCDLPSFDSNETGVGSPYYLFDGKQNGYQDGLPWTIINSGEIPQDFNDNTYHGYIRLNFDQVNGLNWYNGITPPQLNDGVDLFTTVYHQALHMLGIYSNLINPSNGNSNGIGFLQQFSRYDKFLKLINTITPPNNTTLIEQFNAPDFYWQINSLITNQNASFYSSCQNPNPNGPDMVFDGSVDELPIFTGSSFSNRSFSHLSINCDGAQTAQFLMDPGQSAGVRKYPTTEERQLLCDLGYAIASDDVNCLCAVGGVSDFGPNCSEPYVVNICETLVLNLNELISNDPNAIGILHMDVTNDFQGTVTANATNDVFTFTPASVGLAMLQYIPIGCNGKEGNATFIYINIQADPSCVEIYDCESPSTCGDSNIPDYPIINCIEEASSCDLINNPCNLVCNPSFCGTVYGPNNFSGGLLDFPFFLFTRIAHSPDWIRTHGTPDFFSFDTSPPFGSGIIQLGGGSSNDIPHFSEGVMNSIELGVGNYLLSIHSTATSTINNKAYLKFIEGSQIFTPPISKELIANYTGVPSIDILEINEISSSSWNRFGNCVEVDSDAYDALWIHTDPFIGAGNTKLFDDVEVVRDNFTAGSDITVPNCDNPIQLGEEFCMLSGIEILYTWTNQANEIIASYSVIDGVLNIISGDVNPDYTVTIFPQVDDVYTLSREITNYGGLDPDKFALCNTEDDVIVDIEIDCMTECPCTEVGGINIDAGEGTSTDDIPIDVLPTVVNGGCISISGKLIIDGEYTWNGVTVKMSPGAEIEIDGWGSQLNIQDGTEIFGCMAMWKGIVVGGGTRLDMEDSEIRDAQFAITARDGCRIRLFDNIFNANNHGVYTAASPTSQFFKTFNNSIPWTNNTFQCTYNLLPSYGTEQVPAPGDQSRAGIWLRDVAGISHILKGEVNYFEGSLYGIIVDRGHSVKLYDMEIKDLVTIGLSFGTGIRLNDSDNIQVKNAHIGTCADGSSPDPCVESLRVGIDGRNVGGYFADNEISSTNDGMFFRNGINRNLIITRNDNITSRTAITVKNYDSDSDDFCVKIVDDNDINGHSGIVISECNSTVLIDNNDAINIDPIYWGGTNGAGFAVRISNSEGRITVRDNIINFSGLSAGSSTGVGFSLANTQNCLLRNNIVNGPPTQGLGSGISIFSSVNNILCCNTVNNSDSGVRIQGISNELEFRNTTFGSHKIGLQLLNAEIGPQINAGNNWQFANTQQYDARFTGDFTQIPFSLFITSSTLIPDGWDKINVPQGGNASDWFVFLGSDPSCNTANNCGADEPWEELGDGPVNELSDIDIKASLVETSTNPIAKGLKWESQQNLFAKLKAYPNLVALDNSVTNFYNQSSNSTLSDFYALKEECKFIAQTGISGTNYWTLKSSLQDLSNQLDSVWGVWEVATTQEKLGIELEIDNLIFSIGVNFDELKLLENQLKVSRELAIDVLIQDNSAISVNEIYESNEQSINDIFLKTIAKGIYSFTVDQKVIVDNISAQCPFIGGTSVYKARTLQRLYNAQEYDDEALCEQGSKKGDKSLENIEVNNTVRLYPNPAKDHLTVHFSEELDNVNEMVIYDLTGEQVYAQQLTPGMTKYVLNLLSLSPGIYFYSIKDEGKQSLFSGKIVVLK